MYYYEDDFYFIDGLGLGDKNPEVNPIYRANTPALDWLLDKYGYYKTDACLGIDGLPQSATGQATIYTGVNASKVLGRHWPARPTEKLRDIIMNDNLFIQLKKKGYRVTFANAYTNEYLERMYIKPRGIFKPSVTTLMCMSAQVTFRVLDDYLDGLGICHDINGRKLIQHGYDVPLITPMKAAENLYRISRDYDFTLFEFFMSDIVGHSMDMNKAVFELELMDSMLENLLARVDLNNEYIIIASDHGNIEDITVSTHTMNPVPVIVAGRIPKDHSINIHSLTDITPEILRLYEQRKI